MFSKYIFCIRKLALTYDYRTAIIFNLHAETFSAIVNEKTSELLSI